MAGRHSKLNTQISEEAAEWFVELRAGELNEAGRAQFDAWVRSSPQHLRAYLEIAAIWKESESLQTCSPFALEPDDAADNVVRLPGSREQAPPDPGSPSAATSRRTFAIAASLGALLAVAGATVWLDTNRWQTYATEVGEHRSVRLADGSTVELNSRSRIRVRFVEHERRVELIEGQVLFQVAKDHVRPFIVRADTTHVRAVGTQFDVNRKRSATVVTVLEGRVAVSGSDVPPGPHPQPTAGTAGRAALLLVAGEQMTLTQEALTHPVRTNVSAVTAWTQNQIVLDAVRLEDVAEEFNRYSERPLIVDDHGSSPLRLSGVFSTDPRFLISYLRARDDITVLETQRNIRITRHD